MQLITWVGRLTVTSLLLNLLMSTITAGEFVAVVGPKWLRKNQFNWRLLYRVNRPSIRAMFTDGQDICRFGAPVRTSRIATGICLRHCAESA